MLQAALDGRDMGTFAPNLCKIAIEKYGSAEGWGFKGGQELVRALRVSPDDETHEILKSPQMVT
jgi:hypothetical protein